jgi:hypothetical protein
MHLLTNKFQEKSIFVETLDNGYGITLEKFWFFTPENFLFTLEKTFEPYDYEIFINKNIYKIYIKKKYKLGFILKNLYFSIYKNWLFY